MKMLLTKVYTVLLVNEYRKFGAVKTKKAQRLKNKLKELNN